MSSRLASILQIRAGEAKMVAFVAALFAFIEIGRGIGGNTADGLFFVRFGVQNLPYMYMILGAATFVVMVTYAAGLGRVNPHSFFVELLVVIAAVLLVERAAVAFDFPILYAVVWITINIISLVLGTFVWTIATGVCDTRQAKRLFSLFTSAGILGGVVGNFLTGTLAKAVGTENLLILYAVLIVVSLVITREITRRYFKSAPTSKESHFIREIRVGFDFVRTSPLLRLIGVGSVLFSVLYFSISFPFSKIVSASLSSEAEIAGFLGTFSGVVTLATFLVSLFLANRLYTRIGIVNSLLLLPITYLIGFVFFALSFSLPMAIVVRFAQMVVLGGIASPGAATIYNIVPPEKRAQVQSFDSGVTAQIGIALSGVLLILGEQALTTTQIFLMGGVFALICSYLVWRMRKGYADALLHALRAGFIDVFTGASQGLQNLGTDTNARRVAIEGLRDSKPAVRRVSAEIIGKLNARDAIEPLTQALDDSNAEVRFAAIHALVHLDARDAVSAITARLNDSEPTVRTGAIDALAALSANGGSRDILVAALRDPNPSVKSRAAVALDHLGNHEDAHAAIETLLDSDLSADWIAGLDALAETPDIDSFHAEKFLRNDSALVRAASVHALAASKDHRALLVSALDDADARVREAAAVAFKSSAEPLDEIVRVLYSGSERAQDAALNALDGHGADAQKEIVDWALLQIRRVSDYRAWSAAFRRSDECTVLRGAHYLRDLLDRRERQATRRILRALALIGTPDAIQTIAKGLQASSTETRAQAIEALDTLGEKRIARGLIPLLEESSSNSTDGATTILRRLTLNPDPWFRALAVHAIGEMLSRDLHTLSTRAHQDADPIVREAAIAAIGTGGEMTETLKTLGTIDRILFLRQVPVFADLEPEDLKQIAEIASERIFLEGDYLCREGEIGDELFVIVEGQVLVTKGSNGDRRTLRTLNVGEQIGELAILREQPRSASVIAENGMVRALVIRGDALRTILSDRPEVALAMLASLAQRLSTN